MTLYAPDGLQMIMMERFEGLTTSVDCKGDDGSMSLTFKSQEAFNYALQTWSYINENDDDRFLLIANHDGCGPDDQRQPYLITKVTQDTQDLTTLLTAQVAAWSEVAGTYDLDFGKVYPSAPSARKLKERGLLDWSENPKVTFPMTVGKEGERTNIYTDSKGRLTLDCINCYITGSFQVTGHLEVHVLTIKEFTIDAAPSGLAAELELEAAITASSSPDSLQFSKELFSFPIPDAGFEVPGIMKLGAILSYDVGASISFQGTGTVDFGLKSTIPDSAQAVLSLVGSGQSSATGFTGSLEPVFDVKQLSASVTLSAYSQPKLAVEIEVTKVGTAEASLSLKLPEVSVTLEADYEEAGVCSQDPGSSKTGVKLSSEVTVELDADADLKFGDDNPSWSKQLASWSTPLPGACYPINIPGLGPTQANATSVPTLPSASLTASASASSTGSPATTNGSSPASLTYTVPSAVPIRSQNNSLYIPSSLYQTRSSFPTGTAGSPGTISAGTTGFPAPTSGPYGNSTLSGTGSGIASIATSRSLGSSRLSGTGSASAIIPTATSIGGSSKNLTSATRGHPANTFSGASLSGYSPSATNSSGSTTAGSTALTSAASASGSGPSGTSLTISSPTSSPPFPVPSSSSSSLSGSPSSSSSSTKKAGSTGTPATGGGGCKMRRGENGKRMLVC